MPSNEFQTAMQLPLFSILNYCNSCENEQISLLLINRRKVKDILHQLHVHVYESTCTIVSLQADKLISLLIVVIEYTER